MTQKMVKAKRKWAGVDFEDTTWKKKARAQVRKMKTVTRSVVRHLGIMPEVKWRMVEGRDATLASAGAIVEMASDIGQSDTVSGRTGNRIAITKVEVNMTFDRPAADISTGLAQYCCNWYLIHDKQANEAAPTLGTDLTGVGSQAVLLRGITAANGYGVMGMRNPQTMKRFNILKQGHVNLAENATWNFPNNPVGSTRLMSASWTRVIKVVKVFKNPLVIQYNETAAGISGVVGNNICLGFMPCPDEAIGVSYQWCIHYTDV